MKSWKLFALAAGLFVSLMGAQVHAVDVFSPCEGGNVDSKLCEAVKNDNATSMVKKIVNLMLFGLGITAVIMIIHGGLKYVISRGDPANIKSAKDTVLYAVIGLVVAILAYAIVNFVVTSFR